MIQLDDITVRSGDFVLSGISLTVPKQHYGVLMGRTGCGKTTLLEAICGLRPVDAGRVLLHGRDVTRLRSAERGIGYVPQDAALFSTISVRNHLAYAMHVRHWDAARVSERVDELAKLLEISQLLDRTPHGLSGGESRRVALGRALSFYPTTLLLDEPLNGLDDATRDKMIALLKMVQQTSGVTLLHVTHSREDAERLGDCRFVMREGKVVAE
jgi:ABC-type sugar transport system ATPase subunit